MPNASWLPKRVRFSGTGAGMSNARPKPIPSLIPLNRAPSNQNDLPGPSSTRILTPPENQSARKSSDDDVDPLAVQLRFNSQMQEEIERLRKTIDMLNEERDFYKMKSSTTNIRSIPNAKKSVVGNNAVDKLNNNPNETIDSDH